VEWPQDFVRRTVERQVSGSKKSMPAVEKMPAIPRDRGARLCSLALSGSSAAVSHSISTAVSGSLNCSIG
jgi:hypothetical protein